MTTQNKLDLSPLTEAEYQAIKIHLENIQNGTDSPTFPFSAVVFEELAENLASVAMVRPNSAFTMVNEINAINKVLLRIAPIAPTKDKKELATLFTDEEILKNSLACNVCYFLVSQFSNISKQILAALEMREMAEQQGGENATKH